MKPAVFEYHCPGSLEEALALISELGPDAKFLAGGQTLVPAMSMRLARCTALVDLNRIAELAFIRDSEDALEIGAMTRQRNLERSSAVGQKAGLLHLALPHLAHFQIRNRGTIGGSLSHNDPAAELPAVASALDAELVLARPNGSRTLSAQEFFTGFLSTALEDEEILHTIRIPAQPANTGFGFAEIARRHGDFALAGAAAVLRVGSSGAIDHARLVLFGVHDGPYRATGAEGVLLGSQPQPELWREAAAAAVAELDPPSDHHASGRYRGEVAEGLARRALEQAWRGTSQ